MRRSYFCSTVILSLVLFTSLMIAGCGSSKTSNQYLAYVAGSNGANILLRGVTTWSDMVITTRIKFTSGINYISVGRAGAGLTSYHLLAIQRMGYMEIYKTVGGVGSYWGSVATPAIQDDQWYTFKLVINGTHFMGYLDGVKYTDYTDSSGSGETQGNVMIMADDDRSTTGRKACFDDIVVTNGDGTVTYFTEDFQSYSATTNWTPVGGWNANETGTDKGVYSIIRE